MKSSIGASVDPNLQEFTDPVLYDAENAWSVADDFYLALAQDAGGPVLDVACGTGRLTHAIARSGLDITGIDIMPAMLDHARASRQRSVTWIEADCRTVTLDRQFRCVLMTGHAFQNLLTNGDQHAFFDRMHAHTVPGGMFAFETRNLHAKAYGTSSELRPWRSFQHPRGERVDVLVASRFDRQSMLDHVQLVRNVRETGVTWSSQIVLRYTEAAELNERLAAHGFAVVAQYGDWDRSAYQRSSPEIITICHRPA